MTDWCVLQGDCLERLRELPDCSVDAICTDPPAGISFMGRSWDTDKGGPQEWIAWLASIMRECLRVLKPGGHALVWAIPRTSHWTGMAIELAGFEVRDVVTHLFGSGFPKSKNVSLAIDETDTRSWCPRCRGFLQGGEHFEGRACGTCHSETLPAKAARAVVRTYTAGGNAGVSTADKGGTYGVGVGTAAPVELAITRGASERSRAWDGWGTSLKPACEFWFLARKPLEGTVARNVTEFGTGALNVDGCRIGDEIVGWGGGGGGGGRGAADAATWNGETCGLVEGGPRPVAGRWPANVVLSCDCYQSGDLAHAADCPVAMLDAQSGNRPGMSGGGKHRPGATPGMFGAIDCTHTARADQGGASRFFYTAKTSTREREAGCEQLPKKSAGELVDRDEDSAGINNPRAGAGRTSSGRANHHPTVKPLALMRWLVRLITPPGGIVLDPFCGSGSTGCAAVLEGLSFLGIEQDPEYVAIAEARIAHWEAA